MHLMDNGTQVGSLGTPQAASGTPGYAATGVPGTFVESILDPDLLNTIIKEIVNVVTGAGLTLDRTNNGQLLLALNSLGRIKLTGPLTLFVSTAGNDGNNGLSSGTAFATLQHADAVIRSVYDTGGQTLTIQVADSGTPYAPLTAVGAYPGGGQVVYVGNTTTPDNCVISATNASCFTSVGAQFSVQGFKLTATGTGAGQGSGIYTSAAGSVVNVTGHMDMASCAVADFRANAQGQVVVTTDYSVSGTSGSNVRADSGGAVEIDNHTATLVGTPTFTDAFATAVNGTCLFGGTVFSGAATGVRYSASANGVVNTAGQSGTYLPGNAGGSLASGGQYV